MERIMRKLPYLKESWYLMILLNVNRYQKNLAMVKVFFFGKLDRKKFGFIIRKNNEL